MILDSFQVKFSGDFTEDVKNIFEKKIFNIDFSKVAKMCIKITTGMDFLLYELNDIVGEISKNINDKLNIEMQILVDSKYKTGTKNIEILTSNNCNEWRNQPFLSFREV